MNESLNEKITYSVPDVDIISKFKKEKTFPIINNIFDIFKTIADLKLEKDNDNDSIIRIIKLNEDIGQLKIQKKKIILLISKINLTIEFDIANYSDNINIIPEICKNI